jgi:hypothetical protein
MIRLGRRRPHRDLVQDGLQESAISLAMRWLEIISIGDRAEVRESALGRFELDRIGSREPMRTAPVTHSLDADDLFVGLVVAAGRLSNHGGVATDRTTRRRAGRPHRIRRCAGIDLVADVLDDHSLVSLSVVQPDRQPTVPACEGRARSRVPGRLGRRGCDRDATGSDLAALDEAANR